ncbi:MAG: TlpA disulfide reductase family protein, partial [Opitutales bacterium]
QGKKVVVLDFWATWCGPCVKAMPEVKAATDALKAKGVILVAVNQGERPGIIQKFLKKNKWDGLSVGLDPEGDIADKFGVEGIPQTVIIDKEGVIREVHVGYEPGMQKRLLRELNEILAD